MKRHDQPADGTIVPLSKRKATQRSKVMVDLLDYWQSLRPESGLPARADIDPRRIEGALPYAFVLERLAPGVSRLRVAGGHLTDLMGMDVRGMPLSALIQHPDRNKLMGVMDKVYSVPRALEMELTARSKRTRKVLHADIMILPLLDDAGMVTRAIGCLVARGGLPDPPYRFQIDSTRETDIEVDRSRLSFASARPPKPKVPQTETLAGRNTLTRQVFPVAETGSQPAHIHTETAPVRPTHKAPFLRLVKS